MRAIASIAAIALLLAACGAPDSRSSTVLQPGPQHGDDPRAAPMPAPAPSIEERHAAVSAVLELLSQHIVANQLDYHFNSSGEGVCLGTAGLAFIGSGSTLGRGPFKPALARVLARLKQIMDTNDFPLQPTWGCAQSTILLAELHRTAPSEQRDAVAALLAKYVDKLVRSQTARGSWCHTFEDVKNSLNYDDLVAVSVMAMQGLGMAVREGVPVDPTVIAKGLAYIENSSDVASGHIGYSPRPGQHGMSGAGRTGGGLLALNACGQGRSRLSKAAGAYLIQSFPSTELNSGHASAQLSQSWAAWWAAENGCYDKFWAGQGALIMARRKPDGGFHCAPSDGKPGDPAAEMGDFANAMHALMLIAPEGLIFSGEAKDSPQAALEDAAGLLETWADAPECVKKLAALKSRPAPPAAGEVARQLAATIKELAKIPGERSGPAILALLGTSVTCQAGFDAKARTIRLDASVAAARIGGLAKAKLVIAPVAELMTAKPQERSLTPGSEAQRLAIAIATRTGQEPTAPLEIEVHWDLAGLAFTQKILVPAGKIPGTI